jgi:hypothetical protein
MITGYYNCFSQVNSTDEILESFRKFYPEEKIVLINDFGDQTLLNVAKKFNCDYYYELVNNGYPGGNNSWIPILNWVKRFLKYIKKIDTEWFILLEDDVFIMDKVDETTLLNDINGINNNNILPIPVNHILKRNEVLIYGAMGGAIFRTSFFKNMEISLVENFMELFGNNCPPEYSGQNWYYSDVVLSYLAYAFNGTLGSYPQFCELWFSDLNDRIKYNKIAVLNQYKFLFNFPSHPNLFSFAKGYTIFIPTKGEGDTFELFVNVAMNLYEQYLNKNDIFEFIICCPEENIDYVKFKLNKFNFPFVYFTDSSFCKNDNSWIKQQIIKLDICNYIKTKYYLILDDDMYLTKKLSIDDFFDKNGNIYYSFESWSDDSIHFANNTNWLSSSCEWLNYDKFDLKQSTKLMGVTPQLFITRIVHQLLHVLGKNWKNEFKGSEYSLYWIYLLQTLRTHYYTPDNRFFAMDHEYQVLVPNLSNQELENIINNSFNSKKYYFLVIQSWLNYKLITN